MAYNFDGSADYLTMSYTSTPTLPFCVSLWFKTTGTGADALWSWSDTGTSNAYYYDLLYRGDVSGDPIEARTRDATTTSTAQSTTGTGADGNWHHAFGQWGSGTNYRGVWLNGGSHANETTARSTPGKDRMRIGWHARSNEGLEFTGDVAEVGIWDGFDFSANTALISALAAGYCPLAVRPGNLVAYYPLVRDSRDRTGVTGNWTEVSSPANADHPPIIYPAAPHIIHAPAGAAPAAGPNMLTLLGVG